MKKRNFRKLLLSVCFGIITGNGVMAAPTPGELRETIVKGLNQDPNASRLFNYRFMEDGCTFQAYLVNNEAQFIQIPLTEVQIIPGKGEQPATAFQCTTQVCLGASWLGDRFPNWSNYTLPGVSRTTMEPIDKAFEQLQKICGNS